MDDLSSLTCRPCRGGEPPIPAEELNQRLREIPEWSLIDDGGVRKLTREFAFRNFREALAFTDRVGALAESRNHHPLICTEWGRVTVTWWTHAISDLHLNDCIMAAATDRLD